MTSPDFRAGLLGAAEIGERKSRSLSDDPDNGYMEGDTGAFIWTNKEAEWVAIVLDEFVEEIRAEAAAIKDEPQGSAIDNYCAGLERTVNELRERNARLVEALRLIGQKDHKGRPGWSAGAANKLANEALAANEEPK